MSDELAGVNEPEVAAPVSNEQIETPSANTPEVATPEVSTPVQSAEDNARFAEVRRNAEQVARDNLIKEMYGSQGITTYEQYQQALAAQRAAEEGQNPVVYALQQEVASMKRDSTLAQQEKFLADRPHFKDWESDIKAMADEHGADYETAYAVKLVGEFPNIQKQWEEEKKTIADNAIKEYLAKKEQPSGVVESGNGATPVVEAQTPKTFADAKANAMEILKQAYQGGS